MTYIDMINNILKRLRERVVSSNSETEYSSLIGIFINDAKGIIENSWHWSGLRTTLSVNTAPDIFAYELNGTANKFTMLDVVNDTSDLFMEYKSAHEFNNIFLNSTPATGSPNSYSYNGVSSDGDTQVDIYPVPDGAYTLRFNMVLRSANLAEDSDYLNIPDLPVLMLAYAMAVEERGEDGGITSVSAYTTATSILADAIAQDVDKHPEETVWYAS